MSFARLLLSVLLLFSPTFCWAETFQEIADHAKPGVLGVAVYDFHSGATTSVNLRRSFPMQSVFKAFLGADVLAQVDAGRLSLDKIITLAPEDIRDGVGSVDHSGGGKFSIRALLRAALIESDNSAADALVRVAGGPARVTAWLRSKDIQGIRIDRDERGMARDIAGVPADFFPGRNASSLKTRIPHATQRAAFEAAMTDPRDTATPEAAIHFLIALKEGDLLTPISTDFLLGCLRKTKTGPQRLKAGFPPKTLLAHKTGTSGTFEGVTLATNDMGLATLPDGHLLAIAVFLSGSPAPEKAREELIATCASIAAQAH